jgi:hypothetical protein
LNTGETPMVVAVDTPALERFAPALTSDEQCQRTKRAIPDHGCELIL